MGSPPAPVTVLIPGARTPVSLLQVPAVSATAAVTRATSLPAPGEWIVAVWRVGDDVAHVPGHFAGVGPIACGAMPAVELLSTLPLAPAMIGGPVVNLDGEVIAVVVACPTRPAALAVDSVTAIVDDALSPAGTLWDRYGLRTAALSPIEREYFGVTTGAIVRELELHAAAWRAGLHPGDVVVSADGRAIDGPTDLGAVVRTATDRPTVLRVWRQRRARELALPPPPIDATAELVIDPAVAGQRIGALPPNHRAAAAGLRSGDRIVRIDYEVPRDGAAIGRRFAAGRPLFVEIERDGRRLGVVVP
jgi:S1-C subfamily serine protease